MIFLEEKTLLPPVFIWTLLVSMLCSSCDGKSEQKNKTPSLVDIPKTPDPISNWASRVHPIQKALVKPVSRKIDRALQPDPSYDSEELEPIRRVVYRVSFSVPPTFREGKSRLIAPAGELFVDVSRERLKARFVGPGWPVEENSEVRLRRDAPGVYVFDGRGGRYLGPGKMASWFEGNRSGSSKSFVRVRREHVRGSQGPGDLVCALLAEWTAHKREIIMRRCSGGKLPPGFRLGPWGAELTALVPMEIERYKMRADEQQPPQGIEPLDSRSILASSELSRIAPIRSSSQKRDAVQQESVDLIFSNNTVTRAIVIVEGVPVGWVSENTEVTFTGFISGLYRIGAMRPLGSLLSTPRNIDLPGRFRLGKPDDL